MPVKNTLANLYRFIEFHPPSTRRLPRRRLLFQIHPHLLLFGDRQFFDQLNNFGGTHDTCHRARFRPPRSPAPRRAGLARPFPLRPRPSPGPPPLHAHAVFHRSPAHPAPACRPLRRRAPRLAARLAHFRAIPADRLLVETDAPVKAPAPDGTVLNHPANVVVAYAALAALRALPLKALAAQVATNFTHLFAPESPH